MGKTFEITEGNKTKKYSLEYLSKHGCHIGSKRAGQLELEIRKLIVKYNLRYISLKRKEYPIVTKKDNHFDTEEDPPNTPVVDQSEPFVCDTQTIA